MSSLPPRVAIAVIGGGPAGFFGAIESARELSRILKSLPQNGGTPRVVLLEASSRPLRKVLLSGGGRCNVMHRTLPSASDLATNYPRGRRGLIGPFSTFTQDMTREWFQKEGVGLKVEGDGRVFPDTDDSATIASALKRAANRAQVELWTGSRVRDIAVLNESPGKHTDESGMGMRSVPKTKGERNTDSGRFEIYVDQKLTDGGLSSHAVCCDAVLLATGSAPAGYGLAASLGQPLEKPYPSLFSFRLRSGHPLEGLQGVSLPDAELTLKPQELSTGISRNKSRKRSHLTREGNQSSDFAQRGPLLITHRGISGPAALRLSAFAARTLNELGYEGVINLNLVPDASRGEVSAALRKIRSVHGRRAMSSSPLAFSENEMNITLPRFPRRLWHAILRHCRLDPQRRWSHLSNADATSLETSLMSLPLPFKGKDTNKEEFVTAGGVSLDSINLQRMESKRVRGLHFAGELLNIDGITGGFNFQNCWTSGHIAGTAMAESVSSSWYR